MYWKIAKNFVPVLSFVRSNDVVSFVVRNSRFEYYWLYSRDEACSKRIGDYQVEAESTEAIDCSNVIKKEKESKRKVVINLEKSTLRYNSLVLIILRCD